MHSCEHSRRHFLKAGFAALPLNYASNRTSMGQESQQAHWPKIPGQSQVASGERGVVASVHPLASQAAIDAFERGGNAIDAAIAASLMLSVVNGHNSGIGGGCLALLKKSDGTTYAIDGREMAPAAATPKMFFRAGKPDPMLSRLGPLAVGTPGLLAALEHMGSRHGAIPWQTAITEAAEVAERGFVLTDDYANVLRSVAKDLRSFPSSAAILLDSQGAPWKAGDELRQPDLANSLRSIAANGIDWFYKGEFAERCSRYMKSTGGVLTSEDFANYHIAEREPVHSGYRGNKVFGFPPPSSGGIHISQMLGMLSHFDLNAVFQDDPAVGYHLLLEAMKRAMADRAYWLGDSDFTNVPKGLLDEEYLKQRAASIRLDRVTPINSHGQPPRADVDLFGQGKHTTHLTTADAEGNIVALTQTVNTSFGCKMIIPGTGIILNNELDDFSIAPGVRNAFGLLGSDANLIAPGKRPLSSMSPTIALGADGETFVSCGAAGGPKIITATLQVLVRTLDLGLSIDEAITAPRVHHQWSPDRAICEENLPDVIVQQLIQFGHNVDRIARSAVAQGCSRDTSQRLTAASDPRVPSQASGR